MMLPRWIDDDEIVMLRLVSPGLYLGAEGARRKMRWSLVIDLYGASRIPVDTKYLLRWPMLDGDPVSPALLDAAVLLVREARGGRKGPVLVHCQAGLSRSASVVYGLLRRLDGLGHHDALRRVLVDTPGRGKIQGFPVPQTLASVKTWVSRGSSARR
jgi:protein-tyrosine phosphatase